MPPIPSIIGVGVLVLLGPSSSFVVHAGSSSATSPAGPWHLTTDQPVYRVDPVASTFRVSLVLAPVPGAGIVSYGITFKFDAEAFDFAKPSIEIPAGLDHNGFAGPGALIDSGPGFIAVKGTVDFLGQAIVRYDAPTVLAIILAPKDVLPGETSVLTLEPYYTAGPNEALWVDGAGRVLDKDLVFTGATVQFIPEPSVGLLLLAGTTTLAARCRRRRLPRRSLEPRSVPHCTGSARNSKMTSEVRS